MVQVAAVYVAPEEIEAVPPVPKVPATLAGFWPLTYASICASFDVAGESPSIWKVLTCRVDSGNAANGTRAQDAP